ncbi:MAG: GNAT family N-acetyltransferase [Chloroflexota bacterium]|nr:GNAT family N-acetyltransferase [Chloroflexota bacterium]
MDLPCTVPLKDGREVTIREATLEDAFGVLLLIDAIARERRWLLNTDAHWGVEGQRQWIRSVQMSGGTMLLAEDADGAIVAWADLSRPQAELAHHTATLGTGVHESYRGVGLGRELLTLVAAEARRLGIEKLDLNVRSTNTRAIHLYQMLGWQHEGRSPRAYKQDGEYEDKLYMGLWLDPAPFT